MLARLLGSIHWTERAREVVFGLSLLVSVLGIFVVGELGYRLYLAQAPKYQGFDWYSFRSVGMVPEGALGEERFLPNTTFGDFHVNSLGFRGPEVTLPKPPGTFRIAFLGNSKILGAELPEPETIAGRIMADLRGAFPDRAFDYVMLAGPEYGLETLAKVVREEAPRLRPDLYLVLAGTVSEVLRAAGSQPLFAEKPGFLSRHSRLWAALATRFHLEREKRRAKSLNLEDLLPRATLDRAARDGFEALAEAVGGTPVVSLLYRDYLAQGQDADEQAWATHWFRTKTRGMTPVDVLEIRERVLAMNRAVSREHGWRVLDPLEQVPRDLDHYTDPHHLSAAGAGRVADLVVQDLFPLIPGPELYTGRTIVTGRREETRGPGLLPCLRDVLVKVSGDPAILDSPRLPEVEAQVQALVSSHSYRDRMESIPVHDEQGSRDRPYDLTVQFRPKEIDQAVADLGFRPWLSPRPTLEARITVRFGDHSFALTADGPDGRGHREAIAETAWTLGLPVTLPASQDTVGAARLGIEGSLSWDPEALSWRGEWRFQGETWRDQARSFDGLYAHALGRAMALISML